MAPRLRRQRDPGSHQPRTLSDPHRQGHPDDRRRANPQRFCDRVISVPAPQVIQALKTFREFWQSIRNHTMLHLYVLGSAAAHAEMADFTLCEAILSELDSLDPSELPTLQAREVMVRGVVQGGVGRLEEPSGFCLRPMPCSKRPATMAASSSPRCIGCGFGFRGVICRSRSTDLRTLDSHRLFQRSSWIQAMRPRLLRAGARRRAERGGAEQALVSYERIRRRQPSAWRDLQVYRAVAGLRAQNDDWAQAEVAYRRAVEAMDELARSWPDAEGLRGFLERQVPFLDQVRRCYDQLNRADDAERLIAPIASVGQIEQRLDDERRRQLRRLGRVGRWICSPTSVARSA